MWVGTIQPTEDLKRIERQRKIESVLYVTAKLGHSLSPTPGAPHLLTVY